MLAFARRQSRLLAAARSRHCSSDVDSALQAALAHVSGNMKKADPSATPLSDVPGVRTPGPKMLLRFTCDYEACPEKPTLARIISKRSYDSGIVLVKCPSCQRQHLIADNLGWFGERTNIEQTMRDRGDEVQRVREDDLLHMDPS